MTAPSEIDALLAETESLVDATQRQLGGADDAPSQTEPQRPKAPASTGNAELDRVLRLKVPVIVMLAQRTMALRDVLRLTTGSILEFDKPAGADFNLMINNKCIGTGKTVKIGENFGLSITSIASPQTRIAAMAGDTSR